MKRLGLSTRIPRDYPGCDGYRRGPRPVQRDAHETRHPEPGKQLRILGGRGKGEGREDRLPGALSAHPTCSAGRAMEIVHDTAELETYMKEAVRVSQHHPVLIDSYLRNAVELDVDAGLRWRRRAHRRHHGAHRAGRHPLGRLGLRHPHPVPLKGDRGYRPRVHQKDRARPRRCRSRQYPDGRKDNVVYIIEANPRASRTVPFVSKATGLPIAKIAAKVMIGKKAAAT